MSTLASHYNFPVWQGQKLTKWLDYYTIALNKEYYKDFTQKSVFGTPLDPDTGEEMEYQDPFYNCLINSDYGN